MESILWVHRRSGLNFSSHITNSERLIEDATSISATASQTSERRALHGTQMALCYFPVISLSAAAITGLRKFIFRHILVSQSFANNDGPNT
jgi:hypothetical protein